MRQVVWCWSVAGLVVFHLMLLRAENLQAQDLKPAIRWTVDGAGDWNQNTNWTLALSDPAETGVPGDGEIASVRNGGTAQVTSAIPKFDALAIRDGVVDVGQNGKLDIGGEVVIGSKGSLTLAGNASLQSKTLSNRGDLRVVGSSAAAATSGDFENLGTLILDAAGGDSYSILDVGGSAAFGGSAIDLASLPSGASLGLDSSWPFLRSQKLSGQPSAITVGGVVPNLDRGLGLQVATDNGLSSVTVGSVPIAVVDRTTGSVSVQNAAGGVLDIKGYALTSENGLLSTENWNSLTAQGTAGWSVARPSNTALTELNLRSSSMLAVGDSVDLGAAWSGTVVSPRAEDAQLNVLLTDGRTIAGNVEYTGPANDLVLNVDRATGSATLQNMSAFAGDFDVTGYSILSESGSLNAVGFSGIGGDDWTNANPQAIALGELNLTGSKLFSNGTSVNLGNLFSIGGTPDLVLTFGVVGNSKTLPGTVEYDGDGGTTGCQPANALAGDLDGNGSVEFADFLTIANNFGNETTNYADGDVDCNGAIEFGDFLTLANNFGKTLGASSAAAVPEPTSGLLLFLGFLGMFRFRKRRLQIAGILVVAGMLAAPNRSIAQEEFDTRFIRIHPESPNGNINSTTEARRILSGKALDAIKNEDLTGTVITVDFGGDPGTYTNDPSPYGNGVADTSMDDFLQYFSGTVTIPEGDWTVGIGRDDGGFLRFTDVEFIDTFDEQEGSGLIVDGDGEILYDGTGGHSWTAGTITVPEGGVTTGIEAAFFERSGGDSFEVAYVDQHYDPVADGALNGFMLDGLELDNGDFGDWNLTSAPFNDTRDPNDANGDGAVGEDDFVFLSDNWGSPFGFDEFFAFAEAFNAPAGPPASTVPEPNGISLLISGFLGLVLCARRRKTA